MRATDDESYVVGQESFDLAWRPITVLVDDPLVDESIRRMARRWLALRR